MTTPWPISLPCSLLALGMSACLSVDQLATELVSTDFGGMLRSPPDAVLNPSSSSDIATLVRASYLSDQPFPIAARGHGHSTHGQSLTLNGVVVNMKSLGQHNNRGARINVCSTSMPPYADVGGEQLWIEVLTATLKHGLAAKSWTDYLYLTVGGTLSYAGISGQAFRVGPQISNVYEMDVITGKGELMTCSREQNSELFYAVLGGLGQFGIITRARIALEPAPEMVRWVRLLYDDFSAFTKDQEHLISLDGINSRKGFDYVEGSVIRCVESLINKGRSSLFSYEDHNRLRSLVNQHGRLIYCLEVAKYYDHHVPSNDIDLEVDELIKGLSFIPSCVFYKDSSYLDFLNRVHKSEHKLQEKGLWDVPHPWLNVFVPKSRIFDFHARVFMGILNQNLTAGPVLVYPTNRDKWDDNMSAVIPDEEIFYIIGLLRSATKNWEEMEIQNREIIRFCKDAGIGCKEYLPHYITNTEWKRHFGLKWDKFLQRKKQFDPKGILSPGHQIFTSPPPQKMLE